MLPPGSDKIVEVSHVSKYTEEHVIHLTEAPTWSEYCKFNINTKNGKHQILASYRSHMYRAHVITMVANVPVPNRHQAISNHHISMTVSIV